MPTCLRSLLLCTGTAVVSTTLGPVACDAESAPEPVDAPVSAGGKADEIFPTGPATGELLVQLSTDRGHETRLIWQPNTVRAFPRVGQVAHLEPELSGCLSIDSMTPFSTNGGGLFNDWVDTTMCGIAITADARTDLLLPTVEVEIGALVDLEVDVGPTVDRVQIRRANADFALGTLRSGTVHTVAPGDYVIELGRPNAFGSMPWSGTPLQVGEGDHVALSLPADDFRARVTVNPPPQRALPNDWCASPTVIVAGPESNADDDRDEQGFLRWVELDPEGDSVRMFPVPEADLTLYVSGAPVDLSDLVPGENREIDTYRLDVHHVDTAGGHLLADFMVWDIDAGEFIEGRCNGGMFNSGHGIDVPAGNYRVDVYAESSHEPTFQQVVSFP